MFLPEIFVGLMLCQFFITGSREGGRYNLREDGKLKITWARFNFTKILIKYVLLFEIHLMLIMLKLGNCPDKPNPAPNSWINIYIFNLPEFVSLPFKYYCSLYIKIGFCKCVLSIYIHPSSALHDMNSSERFLSLF